MAGGKNFKTMCQHCDENHARGASDFRRAAFHVCMTKNGQHMSDVAEWYMPPTWPERAGYIVRADDGQRFKIGRERLTISGKPYTKVYARPVAA